MNYITNLIYKNDDGEEYLPGMEKDFPYISSHCDVNEYPGQWVPWHWHNEVELFYIEKGGLEYHTPGGKLIFPAGSGGLVNSNVLHMTELFGCKTELVQYLHIFDAPALIGGQHGCLLERKYVTPITASPQLEIISLFPEHPEEAEILTLLRDSFQVSPEDYDYEIKLRSALSDLWCKLLHLSEPVWRQKGRQNGSSEKVKLMMAYIREHFAEKMTMEEIAAAAYISERECYRAFRQNLNMTPSEYVQGYRIDQACAMLNEGTATLTEIGQRCGLGSSSYFGKVFKEYMGCTPKEYLKGWRDFDKNRQ